MEYSAPYPSSVPHAILVPEQFDLDKMFYGCSVVVEGYLLGIAGILFFIALYFKWGNHKLLIDQSNNVQLQTRGKENIICEVVARGKIGSGEGDDDDDEEDQDGQEKQEETKNSLESEIMAHTLRIYQRRLVYSLTFTIPWVICICFFDVNILVVICGAIFIAFVLLFNMRRMLPQWKITLILYFIPSLACIFPYVSGSHSLYAWNQVKDPLELLK